MSEKLSFQKQNGVWVLTNPILLKTKEELIDLVKEAYKFLDCVKVKTTWQIWRHKTYEDWLEARHWMNPFLNCFDFSVIHGNLLLNEGAEVFIDALTGLQAVTLFNNANARIGVGDSNTAEADTQTGLQGGTTSFKAMDTGYPQKSGTGNDTVTFQSVFGTGDGNHAWNEFTVDNGNTANKNLNRKVSGQGTKSSGQTWTVKVSLQLT